MTDQRVGLALRGLLSVVFMTLILVAPIAARAAPYAAMVMDARTGKVLHATNADKRLHPASLTKMMTLYIAFEAIERGEISLDTVVTVSRNAAAEPPSELGLTSGQKIKLRYLIRAAAVKSANDAATAIGEAISGSEAAFARRMNRTAKSMGMTRTTFKNANGLTREGHMSTARDMTILGRHLLYDYPQYYNLFSRRSTHAGLRTVHNTNRRFLNAYKGADGIKTGYTRAAGFNLVASAERGDERIIATVFGGRSTATRNAKVAELLDLGFRRAPSKATLRKPEKPAYVANAGSPPGSAGKTIRLVTAVKQSLRPKMRPGTVAKDEPVLVAVKDDIRDALTEVLSDDTKQAAAVPDDETLPVATGLGVSPTPPQRPGNLILASTEEETAVDELVAEVLAEEQTREVVTRLSTSGGRHWGINVGRYPSRYAAEKVLVKTALAEMATLDGSLRKVVNRKGGFDANFMGMTRESADLACRRLQARQVTCFMIGPG